MADYYAKFHPKQRRGNECKKVLCERHKDYLKWRLGNCNFATHTKEEIKKKKIRVRVGQQKQKRGS